MSFKSLFKPTVIKNMSGLSAQFSSGLGDLGSGAGKGGGGGGSIRSSGGSFGKREAGLEEEYFHRMQKNQLQDLKSVLEEEVQFHEEQIQRHKAALEKAKAKINQTTQDAN